MKITRRNTFIFITILLTIAVDQISKVLVRTYVEAGSTSPIVGDFLQLMNVENDGAFLGMGGDLNPTLKLILLLILPVIVLGLVLRHVIQDKSLDTWSLFAFASIIGGGIANVYDRFAYGSVTDFLYIHVTDVIRTGIFNFADLSVTTGMIILVVKMFRKKKSQS
ncbi:signal peptidase II [Jejuia pallidilutea]|uniref:Lipoprotein signal peptidase n=1 Tax=Jejuia pallidilutea TaxID=504487 RepID=A0A090VS10_9FLAO|nr:signal peptidase II [Jejuia pallidilutea]GAL66104.1 lipoprotein signal peptidase [Jejuia pallidilutea]GAL70495.1 lipoprotein signal peptidase [Jejuia pallidilutea]GAL88139.1 lipoprotein signal peptidase [Jejuia pallidilutea]